MGGNCTLHSNPVSSTGGLSRITPPQWPNFLAPLTHRINLHRGVPRELLQRLGVPVERSLPSETTDVHGRNLGYDVTSLDLITGELRLIEIKGLATETGTILLTPNERRVAEDLRDCYWLYIVTNCAGGPVMQEPIQNPAKFPWHKVSQVQHYWLQVDRNDKTHEGIG